MNKKKRIMVVDDSFSIRQMMTFTLKQAGYEAIEAVDGKDALTKFATEDVQMLITDLNMPNMDGTSLIREVRKNAANRFMPILMLTTESQESKRQEGKSAGASAWIVKPFKAEQLLGVVKMVLA
ncbi:Fis family transcriptional regulator [Desulfuromonas soudanensis]|uniref:Fis family transcriptional regulator n=1 Tax=Desulfuromonas soudanensis TaxID=1603606 RepID=A0A0M3QFG9_9BACT|nr:response regulator [Desulfuromonas soudanensis]ALC16209.1 Fis family transcriptional regulator [Desulfuromonas soudanensis]